MMENILPLFKSDYSIGKSILTLDDTEEIKKDSSVSVFAICKKHGIEDLYLVEDSMRGFLKAYINCDKHSLNLRYGLRVSICPSISKKNEESRKQSSKVIIFAQTASGTDKLIKIYSKAAQEGFYHVPRIDCDLLSEYWDEEDLALCVPFYDSYIFVNTIQHGVSLPDLRQFNPTFFLEDNDLPFDSTVRDAVISHTSITKEDVQPVQSVYYYEKDDFLAYLAFRCIGKRSDLACPRLDHMGSELFCFENYLNKKEKNERTHQQSIPA